jgi:hypothetical protein
MLPYAIVDHEFIRLWLPDFVPVVKEVEKCQHWVWVWEDTKVKRGKAEGEIQG